MIVRSLNLKGEKRMNQRQVGIPAKRRGQQMGFSGKPDQNRQEVDETPATLGSRPRANKMAADKSKQKIGSSSVTPRTASPSTPAMNSPVHGDTGGEKVFKRRLAKQRSKKTKA
jgi:hypothetical protein